MAATPATDALEHAGISFGVHEYDFESADSADTTYGQAVAGQIGADEAQVFKTLVASVDDRPTVAIVPVTGRLSTKKLARAAGGKKGGMTDPRDAERLTGYVTGGISPFGQKKRLPVYLDETATLFDRIYVSGGRRGIQLSLAPADLVRLLDAGVADLAD